MFVSIGSLVLWACIISITTSLRYRHHRKQPVSQVLDSDDVIFKFFETNNQTDIDTDDGEYLSVYDHIGEPKFDLLRIKRKQNPLS